MYNVTSLKDIAQSQQVIINTTMENLETGVLVIPQTGGTKFGFTFRKV